MGRRILQNQTNQDQYRQYLTFRRLPDAGRPLLLLFLIEPWCAIQMVANNQVAFVMLLRRIENMRMPELIHVVTWWREHLLAILMRNAYKDRSLSFSATPAHSGLQLHCGFPGGAQIQTTNVSSRLSLSDSATSTPETSRKNTYSPVVAPLDTI